MFLIFDFITSKIACGFGDSRRKYKEMTKDYTNFSKSIQFSIQFAIIISQTFCLIETFFDAALRDECAPVDFGFIDFVAVSFFFFTNFVAVIFFGFTNLVAVIFFFAVFDSVRLF